MKYAGIIKNDVAAGEGVCVSFFTQGCPIRCKGCHNQETWDFSGGKDFTPDTITEIIKAISANGVIRNFCVLGGEPLCQENAFLTNLVIQEVRQAYPNIKIYVWSGYTYDQLEKMNNSKIKNIFNMIDVIITGPYIEEQRDITLPMRGSRNQEITEIKKNESI